MKIWFLEMMVMRLCEFFSIIWKIEKPCHGAILFEKKTLCEEEEQHVRSLSFSARTTQRMECIVVQQSICFESVCRTQRKLGQAPFFLT